MHLGGGGALHLGGGGALKGRQKNVCHVFSQPSHGGGVHCLASFQTLLSQLDDRADKVLALEALLVHVEVGPHTVDEGLVYIE